MRKILMIFALAFLLSLSFSSAYMEELSTQKQNTCIDLPQSCPTCSYVTLESIKLPNTTTMLISSNMTKRGLGQYNYSFCQTSLLGEYQVMTILDGNITSPYSFEVTYTGEFLTIEQTYIYIFALIFLVALALGVVFLISRLPSSDSRSDDGLVIQINMLKHLRPVLWAVVWGIGLASVFIISNLGIAYLNNEMLGDFFFMIYQVLFWITIIALPIYFIWIFYKIFIDNETKRLIERGVEIRTP